MLTFSIALFIMLFLRTPSDPVPSIQSGCDLQYPHHSAMQSYRLTKTHYHLAEGGH